MITMFEELGVAFGYEIRVPSNDVRRVRYYLIKRYRASKSKVCFESWDFYDGPVLHPPGETPAGRRVRPLLRSAGRRSRSYFFGTEENEQEATDGQGV